MRTNLLILLLALVILAVSGTQASRRSQRAESEFDEDEFSEFDNLDEEAGQQKQPAKPKQPSAADATPKPSVSVDDDASFDELIEDEDELRTTNQKQEQPAKDTVKRTGQTKQQQQAANLDDLDMEEFEHFVDEEEFEGFTDTTKSSGQAKSSEKSDKTDAKKGQKADVPNLKFTDVPTHLMSTSNWHNYVWEIVMIVVISLYFANFMYGRSKNYRLVSTWYTAHRELLERNFALVGDNGTSAEVALTTANSDESSVDISSKLIKDSENCYGLWCSGRAACDGCLIQLKLIKRQDLINGVIMQLVKPQSDQIVISVEYPDQDSVDSFVFCLANKKITQQLFADYQDLATFCTERKTLPNSSNAAGASIDYKYAEYLSQSVGNKYMLLNEQGEVPNIILDSNVCKFLNKYPDMIEYLLISDQYVGYKVQSSDESQQNSSPTTTAVAGDAATAASDSVGTPKSRAMLILCLNVPGKGLGTTPEDMESMQPALQLAMYLIDKVSRVRLSREAKTRALKKRKDVTEQFLKFTNKQRQEAAQLRKEEKRRAEKDRVMNEEDPEKQRRLEEKILKAEKKQSLSKFKQVKIKSM